MIDTRPLEVMVVKPRSLLVASVPCLAGLAVALTVGGAVAQASDHTFVDPAGDGNGAPDITNVRIWTQPAQETVSFSILAVGLGDERTDGQATYLTLMLSTVKPFDNSYTPNIQLSTMVWGGAVQDQWRLSRWDGNKLVQAAPSPTTTYSRNGDLVTWVIAKADLGEGTRLVIGVGTQNTALNAIRQANGDGAGTWVYDIAATRPATTASTVAAPAKLVIGPPTASPRQPVAGKPFRVTFRASFVAGNHQPVAVVKGLMRCDSSISGAKLGHSETFKAGRANIAMVIPKAAGGKLLKIALKITARAKGQPKPVTSTRLAAFRVASG